MAQRYSGQFSPNSPKQTQDFRTARPTRAGGRANALFFLPLPLMFRAFAAEPVVMATYLAALGTLLLAAWLTREGLRAQEAYEARTIARRPALPRKTLGSVLTGGGLALTGLAGHGPVEAMIFAGVGAVLHFLAFGPDPYRSKGVDDIDSFQSNRVARIVEEAEATLLAIEKRVARLNDRHLLDRVHGLQAEARRLFRTVEQDPRDLTAARKYLTVYLSAARDASDKFVELALRRPNVKARQEYEALLTDLQENFSRQTETLLNDDHIDLEIEIDVLRERLAREGVRLPIDEE